MQELFEGLANNPSALNTTRKPKFVKFKKGDKGSFLPDVIFEDPRTFVPNVNRKGQVHAWGLYRYNELLELPDYDMMMAVMRQTTSQFLYMDEEESPELQFVGELVRRKVEKLESLDLQDLDKRDVILRVKVLSIDDQFSIWRRIRCSAGVKLSVFQDKILQPIMGWVRNFHCYVFTDFRDGSVFGPKDCTSVDAVRKELFGYQYIPDDKYKLAHAFGKEGDTIGYLYDFGDGWYHEITIESILSIGDSDGHVEVLDGQGMCPGENMMGCRKYGEFLKEYDEGSPSKKAEKRREILQCPNYKDFGKPPVLFDPYAFDIAAARIRLRDALASPNSIRSGAKGFVMPFTSDGFSTTIPPKKGQQVVRQFDAEDGYGFWQETKTDMHDKRRETVCAACGKPGDTSLKQCGGCRQILYCSPEHQKAHWKQIHKQQCSRKYLK